MTQILSLFHRDYCVRQKDMGTNAVSKMLPTEIKMDLYCERDECDYHMFWQVFRLTNFSYYIWTGLATSRKYWRHSLLNHLCHKLCRFQVLTNWSQLNASTLMVCASSMQFICRWKLRGHALGQVDWIGSRLMQIAPLPYLFYNNPTVTFAIIGSHEQGIAPSGSKLVGCEAICLWFCWRWRWKNDTGSIWVQRHFWQSTALHLICNFDHIWNSNGKQAAFYERGRGA